MGRAGLNDHSIGDGSIGRGGNPFRRADLFAGNSLGWSPWPSRSNPSGSVGGLCHPLRGIVPGDARDAFRPAAPPCFEDEEGAFLLREYHVCRVWGRLRGGAGIAFWRVEPHRGAGGVESRPLDNRFMDDLAHQWHHLSGFAGDSRDEMEGMHI